MDKIRACNQSASQQGGGGRNRPLVFSEYLSTFWITKCISAAIISTTHDFKSRNNIKLNFNDLSGEIEVAAAAAAEEEVAKWHQKSQNGGLTNRTRQKKQKKQKNCIEWLQGPVMLAADTAGLLSSLLRCVISRENP